MMEGTNASLSNQGNEGDEGQVANLPTFAEQLEGSLKTDSRLAQWKETGLSGLVKDHFKLGEELQVLRGNLEGKVKVPRENATPEQIAEFRKAIGVPEKAEDYKVEKPEKFPEGMVYNEVLEKKFKETAHQLNLAPQQVADLYKMYLDYEIAMHNEVLKSIEDNRQKAVNTLKDIWKGDTYQENTNKAIQSFYKFVEASNPPAALGGVEGIKKWVEENGIGDDPVMVWFFSKTFDLIGDDKFIKGTPAGTGGDVYDKMFPSMAGK